MATAIDLYSGIGGWTLGLKNAGIKVLSSYEWWKDANKTHNINFGTVHKEINIRELKLDQLPKPNKIDFVVGSPPCTQFSYANRGGNGNLADGLIDIKKFLEVVQYLEPKYWAMENVPRVAKILNKEILKGGSLYKFRNLFQDGIINVYDSADFGVPQNRKRMIAGKFPYKLFESYKDVTPKLNLGDVLNALNQDPIQDPIYGIELNSSELTDHQFESNLSNEERRINQEAKAHHPVYNKMNFPDRWDRPSRTITALCTRVSRESIVIKDHLGNVRRLTVRERACLQSFPINFQFYSNAYTGKLRMIGNAIPPLLTFYLAQSMLETTKNNLLFPDQVQLPFKQNREQPVFHKPENEGTNYPHTRSFWFAINGLRFGSGVRFELRNIYNKKENKIIWRINFFYGNSKNIQEKKLDQKLLKQIVRSFELIGFEEHDLLHQIKSYITSIDVEGLQLNWTNKDRERTSPIQVMDDISRFAKKLIHRLSQNPFAVGSIKLLVEEQLKNKEGKVENKKIVEKAEVVFVGMLIGSIFNSIMNKELIEIGVPLIQE